MTKATGFNFYTEKAPDGQWVGRCKELPYLEYKRPVRDTALSGIRRMVLKKFTAPVPAALNTPVVPPVAATPVSKPKINRVAFVIDRSGSMSGVIDHAVKALNDNVATLREQELKTGQKTLVTVVSFDDKIEVLRNDMPLDNFAALSRGEVAPRGSTALMDATGHAIDLLRGMTTEKDYDVSYLVITLTDGEENASKRFDRNSFAAKLRLEQATDLWTFSFLVPPNYANHIANRFGIPPGNIMEWEYSKKGVETYAQATTAGLNNYYAMRSAGVTKTSTFYADTSKISQAQVNANLVDVRADVAFWPVNVTSEVRAFCELQGAKPFVQGAAFYQLLKPEKVQSYKQLIIVNRSTGSVYAGAAARQMLNLPTHDTIRLAPGNHSNYDVYVQSTSVNRKLFAGSKVIYYTKAAMGGHI